MQLIRLLTFLSLFLPSLVLGQTHSPQLPCDFSGKLLRTTKGVLVRYTSDEMKSRATRKVDVSEFVKRADIKGTVVVDVLVGPRGDVVCARSLTGHPIISKGVETALRSWEFSPAETDGKPVAYLGELVFTLCNINCGDVEPSVTIVK